MTEQEPHLPENPVAMQTDLRHIYLTLPNINAVIDPDYFAKLDPMEVPTYLDYIEGRGERRIKSQVPTIQLERLDSLLGNASITLLLKQKITDEFKKHFRDGLDPEKPNQIFDLIGASNEDPNFKGIFSNDLKAIKTKVFMEKKIHQDLQIRLQNARRSFQNDTNQEAYEEYEAALEKLEMFEAQFDEIYLRYGKPNISAKFPR